MPKSSLLERYHDGFEERLERGDKRLPASKDWAEEIVFAIMDDITGRKGFDNEWSDIDTDIQEEILDTLYKKVKTMLS